MTNNSELSGNRNTNGQIKLDIKSLDYQRITVTIPRSASVLDLKNKIQLAFNVEIMRQRLIFQGKVLKDDKSLLDYENLDDGKVVHLVIRPLNAPRNPENDEPSRSSSNNHGTHMASGYAVITVDANLSDLANGGSALSNLFRSLSGGAVPSPTLSPQNSPFSPSGRTSTARPGLSQTLRNSLNNNRTFDYIRQGRRPGLDGLLDMIDSRSPPISLPIPSSMELRLSRTLAYINEVRTLLNTPTDEFEANPQQPFNSRSTNISVSALEMRGRLNQEPNSSSQVSLVVNELADLFQQLVPYFRRLGNILTADTTINPQRQLAEVLKAARVIQILSLSNHFLGSILSTMEIDSEMYNTATSSSSNTPVAEGSSTENKRKREDRDDPSSSSSKQKLD